MRPARPGRPPWRALLAWSTILVLWTIALLPAVARAEAPGAVPPDSPGDAVPYGGEPGSLTPRSLATVTLRAVPPEALDPSLDRSAAVGTVFYSRHPGREAPWLVFVHGIHEGPSYFQPMYGQAFQAGYNVAAVKLDPGADAVADGAILAEQLNRLSRMAQDRLVAIGHSMGGLDVAEATARYGSPAVAALVTLGTPWGGSPLADVDRALAGNPLTRIVPDLLGYGTPSDRWLTPATVQAEVAGLHPRLGYPIVSMVGEIRRPSLTMGIQVLAGLALLALLGYPRSDGVVPVEMQTYPYASPASVFVMPGVGHLDYRNFWNSPGTAGVPSVESILRGVLQVEPVASPR
ncbi:MAG: hypothetical protein QJR14_10620 [Bacillota bacterium]|nr:hypothetical protein [Bacillota bacterium]